MMFKARVQSRAHCHDQYLLSCIKGFSAPAYSECRLWESRKEYVVGCISPIEHVSIRSCENNEDYQMYNSVQLRPLTNTTFRGNRDAYVVFVGVQEDSALLITVAN